MKRAIALLWCCVLASGCDYGLGRALVGRFPPSDAGQKFPRPICARPPECTPVPSNYQPPERRLGLSDFPSCPIELPPDGELDLRGSELELSDCQITHTADRHARVRVLGARLRNVMITLFGPVRLEFGAGSSLALVQIKTDDAEGWSLLLEDAEASDLLAFGARAETLEIARTALERALLSAQRVELETSTLRNVELRVAELSAVATWFEDSRLNFQHGVVSASQLIATQVAAGCETLLLAGTEIVESQLAGCRGSIRVHGGLVSRSALDGPLEADMTNIEKSVLGLAAPTRLWAWNSDVYSTTFCSFSEQGRFANVVMHCAGCEGAFAEGSADVCRAPGARFDAQPTVCPAFNEVVACEDRFPDRSWPDFAPDLDDLLTAFPDAGWLAGLDGAVPGQ